VQSCVVQCRPTFTDNYFDKKFAASLSISEDGAFCQCFNRIDGKRVLKMPGDCHAQSAATTCFEHYKLLRTSDLVRELNRSVPRVIRNYALQHERTFDYGSCEANACMDNDCYEAVFPSIIKGRNAEQMSMIADILKKFNNKSGKLDPIEREFVDGLTEEDVEAIKDETSEGNKILPRANDATGHDFSFSINSSLNAASRIGSTVAVLADISGSMRRGQRMAVLKENFNRLADEAASKKAKLVLASWNGLVSFCDQTDLDGQKAWISSLRAAGGNNMRYAIEQTMRQFPEVRRIHIMGDGDISPFALPGRDGVDATTDVPKPSSSHTESKRLPYSGTDWAVFRSRFPDVRFHFIAFGKDADEENMMKMAEIGNGTCLGVDGV